MAGRCDDAPNVVTIEKHDKGGFETPDAARRAARKHINSKLPRRCEGTCDEGQRCVPTAALAEKEAITSVWEYQGADGEWAYGFSVEGRVSVRCRCVPWIV